MSKENEIVVPTSLNALAIRELKAGQTDYANLRAAQAGLSFRILVIARGAMDEAKGLKLDQKHTISTAVALFNAAFHNGINAMLATIPKGDNAKAAEINDYVTYLKEGTTPKQVFSNIKGCITAGIDITAKDDKGDFIYPTESKLRAAKAAISAGNTGQTAKPEKAKQEGPAKPESVAAEVVPVSKDSPEEYAKTRAASGVVVLAIREAVKAGTADDRIAAVLEKAAKALAELHKAGDEPVNADKPGTGSKRKAA